LFSEQATAARRDYFAGSNSGVVGQDVCEVGDVVEKFTAAPPVPGVPPAAELHRRSGAPLYIGPTSEAALAT
jgi:hypothetical protein